MPKIQFSGQHYYGGNYRFTEPGTYDVDDAKAKQLLADFPEQFEAVEDASGSSKPVSKMNKDELLAYADELGLEVNDQMTNKQLSEVIEQAR